MCIYVESHKQSKNGGTTCWSRGELKLKFTTIKSPCIHISLDLLVLILFIQYNYKFLFQIVQTAVPIWTRINQSEGQE